jgi:hypothetical protein
MNRLDDYRSAMLAAFPDVQDETLAELVDNGGRDFVGLVTDHGLGPLWHERTGRDEFRQSRLLAEAMFLAQERALGEIESLFSSATIDYAVIKGAANRLAYYQAPAVRASFDLDLLVRPSDRVRAAEILAQAGYVARPNRHNIGHELVLSRDTVDVDLHWALLRQGRLRHDPTDLFLTRRRRIADAWMLNAEDSLFMLIVYPAFAKHLAAYGMGLHRVVDIVRCLSAGGFDWQRVSGELGDCGVKVAAWAALRWVELLVPTQSIDGLSDMLADLRPGLRRRAWLDYWLRNNLSERVADRHWLRLLAFSPFLHDRPGDAIRGLSGRYRARRRTHDDLDAFGELLGQ